jgi:hypothetical protein
VIEADFVPVNSITLYFGNNAVQRRVTIYNLKAD